MSAYSSSRAAVHKRETENKNKLLSMPGTSGTSAVAKARDARRDAYLADMEQQAAKIAATAGQTGTNTVKTVKENKLSNALFVPDASARRQRTLPQSRTP